MASKRVLVVDDSRVYQRILSEVLDEHDSLDVVGVAANGDTALELIESLRPDVVTLDILMPEKDGIQTLIEIRKSWPDVKAIMVSSMTANHSEAAQDVMALGASGVAAKSRASTDVQTMRQELADSLLPQIDALYCDSAPVSPSKTVTEPSRLSVPTRFMDSSHQPWANSPFVSKPSEGDAIQIVAIGVSTGGPDALGHLLSELPRNLGVPIVIVQHMPAEFTTKLAARLDKLSPLIVKEAQHGDLIEKRNVYIAPGKSHMVLQEQSGHITVELNQNPPEHSCRPSVDPLFRSIPPIYGPNCLGIIMTGMGADGLRGCQALSKAGCSIIVQDKQSSVVWGMPKLVSMAGLAEQEVPLDELASYITNRVILSHYSCAGAHQQQNLGSYS